MSSDWVIGSDGSRLTLNQSVADGYLNSDKSGKEYKIGLLFAYIEMLTRQVNENTQEIQSLKSRLNDMEG